MLSLKPLGEGPLLSLPNFYLLSASSALLSMQVHRSSLCLYHHMAFSLRVSLYTWPFCKNTSRIILH